MDRWTMKELKETDDIDFAICILNERRNTITPYSPLGIKLSNAVHTLSELKTEHNRSCDDDVMGDPYKVPHDPYKVKHLKKMLEHEESQTEEHYGAHLTHWYGDANPLTIDAGGLRALIMYYQKHSTNLED